MALTPKQAAALHLFHDITEPAKPRSKKPSKYLAKQTDFKGETYDSKKEAQRAKELALMEQSGLIRQVERQPRFLLLDTIRYQGVTYRKRFYSADFRYVDVKTGKTIVEDVKSAFTKKLADYTKTRHLFLEKYVIGHEDEIEFREIV